MTPAEILPKITGINPILSLIAMCAIIGLVFGILAYVDSRPNSSIRNKKFSSKKIALSLAGNPNTAFVAEDAVLIGGLLFNKNEDGCRFSHESQSLRIIAKFEPLGFVGIDNDAIFVRSADGKVFSPYGSAMLNLSNPKMIAGATTLCVFEQNGIIYHSQDGINWSQKTIQSESSFIDGIYIPSWGSFFFTMSDGRLYRCGEDLEFTQIEHPFHTLDTSTTGSIIKSLAWVPDPGFLIGGCDNATIFKLTSSSDTSSTLITTSGSSDSILKIQAIGTTIVCMCQNSILTSSDSGDTWIKQGKNNNPGIKSVAFGNDAYVACGDHGILVGPTLSSMKPVTTWITSEFRIATYLPKCKRFIVAGSYDNGLRVCESQDDGVT